MPQRSTSEEYATEGEPITYVYVTKTVTTLQLGTGDMHPVEAAFRAVAQADEDGRFEFTIPHEDGSKGHYTLTIEREFTEPPRMEY